jgi:hypothetical protein
MRASRRVRRRLLWLVKFLEAWFDREERATTATLSIVQHAKQLVTDERDTQFLLAQSLTLSSKWHEASPLLEQLARGDSEFPSMGLFRAIVETGQIADAVAILERTGADQRWRPLYEALRAAGAGSPDYLNRVAPEVRTVAMEILREIAPRLFSAYSVV